MHNKNFKIRFFSVFSIVLLCIACTNKILQNDTFYIIKLGEFISHHGVDMIDHYSWISGLVYTYPHWLYDLFIYVIYFNFGYFGVYVSTVFLFIILILSVYIINLRVNKNELMAIIISIVIIPCLIGFASARAQLITAILFLWEVYFIEKLIDSGKKGYVFLLVLISLLVANLHATIWPFYFILYLPFIGQHIIYKLLFLRRNGDFNFKKLDISEIKNFKLLLISFILGIFMGFLTPSKICFTYVFKIMLGDSQSYIVEHAPMVLVNNLPFLIFVLVFLIVLIFSDTKIKLKELFMLCGLIFMSLSSVRHVALFFIIGLLYLSILCNRYLINKHDRTLEILSNILVRNITIYLGLFVVVILISCYKFDENISYDYVSYEEYPVQVVEFIKNNLEVDKIHLYNDYNFGSYLLFNDIPVFVDSRCDLYLKEFNGLEYSIFDDAMNIIYNYEEKFNFYGVTHVLISKDGLFYKILIKDDDYQVIYEDNSFILFKKMM